LRNDRVDTGFKIAVQVRLVGNEQPEIKRRYELFEQRRGVEPAADL